MKRISISAICWLMIAACATTTRINQPAALQVPYPLLGSFEDDYGSRYTITDKEWVQDSATKYHLLVYNKDENFFIAKNDAGNTSGGGLYTRIDIIYFDNMAPWLWGYCLTTYEAGSIKEATNTAAADRANPRKGCNGYPFSRMKKQ